MLSCLFSPIDCFMGGLASFADAFLSLFPFGFTGLAFFIGLILGERLGKWGVLAVILGWIAYRFGTAVTGPEPSENFPDGHPDLMTVEEAKAAGKRLRRTAKRKPRTIFDVIRERFTR